MFSMAKQSKQAQRQYSNPGRTRGGHLLDHWRQGAGITLHETAARIGNYPAGLSDILRGLRLPSLRTAVAIETLTDGAVLPRDWLIKAE